jgi:hypothetical protein
MYLKQPHRETCIYPTKALPAGGDPDGSAFRPPLCAVADYLRAPLCALRGGLPPFAGLSVLTIVRLYGFLYSQVCAPTGQGQTPG